MRKPEGELVKELEKEVSETSEKETYSLMYHVDQCELKGLLENATEPLFITNENKSQYNEATIMAGKGGGIYLRDENDTEKLKSLLTETLPKFPFILAFDETKNGIKIKNGIKEILSNLKDYITQSLNTIRKSGDIQKAIADLKKQATKKSEADEEINADRADNYVDETLYHLEEDAVSSCLPTGFTALDNALVGGLRCGRLYGIGAITSLGKTTFALNIADNVAAAGRDVLIFSLEMSRNELIMKSLIRKRYETNSKESIPQDTTTYADFLRGKPSAEESKKLGETANVYKKNISQHIFISEGIGDIGVTKIRKKMESWEMANKKPLVIVDYLQILASPFEKLANEKQIVDKNITELKRIARDFNVPVVAISSFSRANYFAEVGYESFKESGSIEYSADVLIGLQLKIDNRESLKGQNKENEKRQAINEAKSKNPRKVELVILKNRMFKTGLKGEYDYYAQYDYFKEISTEFSNDWGKEKEHPCVKDKETKTGNWDL
jgi:replicative DNA helicase